METNRILRVFFIFVFVVAFSFISNFSFANNLEVTNFAVTNLNTATNTISFACDASWENSWRNTTNYDAVWMFMKYSTDAGVTWKHASMGASGVNPIGFSVPSGFEIIVPSDEKGLFLQRTDLSSGNVSANGLVIVWDYAQDGLTDSEASASNTINKIFAIEMVQIPQGAFYAGDGSSASEYSFIQGTTDNEPWYITSEDAISTTNSLSNGFYYQNTGANGENASGSIFLVPTSFPKGFKSFYLMKYELTEGQWVKFFNTLTVAEKQNHDITSADLGGKNSDGIVNRNTISWDSLNPAFDATTTRPYRPVSYISWVDLAAYADWAALRPITELEYEKAARGKDIAAVSDEFVWGTNSYNQAEATEIYPDSDEDGTEAIFDGAANLNRNNLGWNSGDGRAGGIAAGQKGPLRVGIFAESSTNRVTSGAGYYGNMELSGNLSEMVVTLGKNSGRQFLGTHGDGELSAIAGFNGYATNIDWPGINTLDSARGVNGTDGSGYRGGDFQSANIRQFQVSNRTNAVKNPDSEGYFQRYDVNFGVFQGGRLGRTAP